MSLYAESENGDHLDEPSEDALFMLIEDLTAPDNTFFVIEPDATDANWFATVALHDEDGYEIVRRDPARGEHDVTTDADIDRIASDLTIWISTRAPRELNHARE